LKRRRRRSQARYCELSLDIVWSSTIYDVSHYHLVSEYVDVAERMRRMKN